MSDYRCNIKGCLDKYNDVSSALTWFARAEKELSDKNYFELVNEIIHHCLKKYDYELAERLLQEIAQNLDLYPYAELKAEYRKEQYKKQHLELEELLQSYKFKEAEAFYANNNEFIEKCKYNHLREAYEDEYNSKKTQAVGFELTKILQSYDFQKAGEYCQQNKQYVNTNWYNNKLRFYKEEYVDNQKKKRRIKLQYLIDNFSFTKAEYYYQQNKEHIDANWYNNKLISVVNAELTTLLNQLCQLQKSGIDRSLWNQDYSQRKYDEELIALVSKYISEIREGLDQSPANRALLIKKQKTKLASSRKCITEVKKYLECETKKETDFLDALNAPWKTVLQLQDITTLTKPILTENDSILILNWSQQHGAADYWNRAMTSAREAEVVAFKLYGDLYGNAEDISILQITSPNDDRWKKADIETNGRLVDVKNARTSFSSPNSYSEHCVPRFKLDRNRRYVSISAFLSQYRDDAPQSIIWLGETTMGEIEKLQHEFDSEYLKVTFSTHLNNSFLPAWLFDYPSVCYLDREAALVLIRSPEFVFPRQECDIGSGVLANRVISSKTEGTLGLEAMELERRIKKGGLNRAVLFLHVLDRFCHVSLDDKTFKGTGLDKILFPPFNGNTKNPLGVYDPLETVWNLWKVLVAVSEKCLKEAKRFTAFRLRGANILQGKRHDGNWSTIFAYCGGRLRLNNETTVRCGQNPIHLGQDEPCPSCGRLICHRCGFCSSLCSECKT